MQQQRTNVEQSILLGLVGIIAATPFSLKYAKETVPTVFYQPVAQQEEAPAKALVAPDTLSRVPVHEPALPAFFDPVTMDVIDGEVYMLCRGYAFPLVPSPYYVKVTASSFSTQTPVRSLAAVLEAETPPKPLFFFR